MRQPTIFKCLDPDNHYEERGPEESLRRGRPYPRTFPVCRPRPRKDRLRGVGGLRMACTHCTAYSCAAGKPRLAIVLPPTSRQGQGRTIRTAPSATGGFPISIPIVQVSAVGWGIGCEHSSSIAIKTSFGCFAHLFSCSAVPAGSRPRPPRGCPPTAHCGETVSCRFRPSPSQGTTARTAHNLTSASPANSRSPPGTA